MLKILTCFFLVLCTPSFLFGQIHQWDGQNNGDNFGWSVSAAGDVNGDSIPDILVAAPNAHPTLFSGGSIYVYSGVNGALLYQWDGQNAGDRFGHSISTAGDVNSDGIPDVVIGAVGSDPNGAFSGSVYVHSGADGSVLYQWDGQNYKDNLGWSVSAAGDINNDGFDDVIISALLADNNGTDSGSVYAYSGANGSLLHQWDGQNQYDEFGCCVSAAGDVNGDGFDDVIIGSEETDNNGYASGSAYVYSGANGALLYQWDGQALSDNFGGSVSAAGDVNGDGTPDLVVGAVDAQNNGTGAGSGSAYVYSGVNGSLLYEWQGHTSSTGLGQSVSAAGDVNGDGFADVIVGAMSSTISNFQGSAYVYSGANGALLNQWEGAHAYAEFGCSVSGVGDVNGDGLDDVLIGAHSLGAIIPANGTAYVYSVSATYSVTPLTAGSQATFTVSGAAPNSSVRLGYSLAGPGPFNTVFGVINMTPPIKTLTVLAADVNGDASWTVNVPGSAAGRTLYTQGLNVELLTNSLALTIQ